MNPTWLEDAERALQGHSTGVILKELIFRNSVSDATLKYVVFDCQNKAIGFVQWSSLVAPHMAMKAALNAYSIYDLLDAQWKDMISIAAATGFVEDRSYAVYPYLESPGRTYLGRFICRMWEIRAIFAWLLKVAACTTRSVESARLEVSVVEPLAWMAKCSLLSVELRNTALRGLDAVSSGVWQPKWVFSHNDLWRGNVMYAPQNQPFPNVLGCNPPRIIDWGGALQEGMPFFDAIIYANSARVPRSVLRAYLLQLCAASTVPVDLSIYDLVAGLGRLGVERGELSLERFAQIAQEVFDSFQVLKLDPMKC